MEQSKVNLTCTKCGRTESVPDGVLTDFGLKNYVCSSCRVQENMPMESRIAEDQRKGRKLLTEG